MRETTDTASELQSTAGRSLSPSSRKAPPKARLLLYVFWFGLLAMLTVFLVTYSQQMSLLAEKGQTTEARVTSKRTYTGKSSDYYVDYTFKVNAKTCAGSDSVSRETYYQTHTGDLLTITYLPADPALTHLGRVDRAHVEDMKRMGVLAWGFLTLLFVGATWYLERYYRS